jgi:phosphate transport system substrate-binding protein
MAWAMLRGAQSRRAILGALALVACGARAATFDLSGLPAYKPEGRVQGIIRIWGNDQLELVHAWEEAFKKLNYESRFDDYLLTTPVAFSGLAAGNADIGYMGHSWWRSDLVGFESIYGYAPLEIKYAQGSFDDPKGSTPSPVFIVHKSNPLAGLTLEQLDGIFGAERTGGWRGTKWTTDAARGPEKDIRTWGQLGLTGAWADKPIDAFGIDGVLSNWSDLIHKVVFKGGTKWNPAMKEIVRGGVEAPVDEQLVRAVNDDPQAIAFTFQKVVDEAKLDVKVLPIAATAAGPYVMPSAQTVHDGSYPLTNAPWLYVNRVPGHPLPHRVKEFLRFVLSRQGQELVAKDRVWIPLSPEAAAAELRKLD